MVRAKLTRDDLPDRVVVGRVRLSVLVLMIVASATIFLAILLLTGFDPPDADVKYDWLTAREAVASGGDAYMDVTMLADRYGVEIGITADPAIDIPRSHPRTPGALFLQIPLLLIPFELLFPVVSVVSFLCIATLAAYHTEGRSTLFAAWCVAGAFAITPAFVTLRFAGQSALVAVAALAGWTLIRRGDSGVGAVIVGVAATLKVFPILLIVPLLLRRRWATSSWLAGTVLILNLFGLMLPGVALSRAFETLSGAASLWGDLYSNGSVLKYLEIVGLGKASASVVALVLLGLALAALVQKRSMSPFGYLAVGLLVVPLSWVSYDLILIPAAIVLVTSSLRIGYYSGILILCAWAIPVLLLWMPISSGFLSLIARFLVLGVALFRANLYDSWSLDRDFDRPLHTKFATSDSI